MSYSPTLPPANSEEHRDYELLFQAVGEVIEKGAGKHIGTIRVIQGPKFETGGAVVDIEDLDDDTAFYGFLSVNMENIPLLPQNHVEKISDHEYDIHIPGREFKVILEDATDEELIEEFENILVWFCKYEKQSVDDVAAAQRLENMGDQGVSTVDNIGSRVQQRISRTFQPHLDAARAEEGRNIPIGGETTSNVLGTTRHVVGSVAGVTGQITDTASHGVASLVRRVSSRPNRTPLPPTSRRFRLRKTLNSGLVAAGKVYVAADEKGRAIIQTAGDSTSELLYEKYGEEVEQAAKDTTTIAIDAYKILRFPANFAVKAIIGGAVKSSAVAQAEKAAAEKNPEPVE